MERDTGTDVLRLFNDANKYCKQIEWLNGVLEKLGLPDRCYPLP